jgi:hypothetical protein
MVLLTYCLACKYGDHERHTEVIQAAPEGMLGGSRCKCQGECKHFAKHFAPPVGPYSRARELYEGAVSDAARTLADDNERLREENARLHIEVERRKDAKMQARRLLDQRGADAADAEDEIQTLRKVLDGIANLASFGVSAEPGDSAALAGMLGTISRVVNEANRSVR